MSDGHDDRGNGWVEYRRLVLSELQRLDRRIGEESSGLKSAVSATEKKLLEKLDALQKSHHSTRDDVIALKTKAAMLGFVAGLVPGIISIVIALSRGG